MLFRSRSVFSLLTAALIAGSSLTAQADEREPGPKSKGKVYAWKSSEGLAYYYYIPKKYDPEVGAALTFVLHGSNLDRRWGFANHKAGTFRENDIVVCPDGTTPNGSGGFNSLQGKSDLERLNELHKELEATLKINATFLYGHSQGSFFSFLYAGAYPNDVQGVVGQASGVWIGTRATKKHHHQAIVLMHGTKDPVVPYSNSVGGLTVYTDAKYPRARLRSLDGWNHWPTQHHTEQQLAWCEGMTTEDPMRFAWCLDKLMSFKEYVDPVATYQVAARAEQLDDLPAKVVKAAAKAIASVKKEAEAHISAISKSLGRSKGTKLEDKPWVTHIPLFVRHFAGTPWGDEFVKKWQKTLDKHDDVWKKQATSYWKVYKKDPQKAFQTGIALVEGAFFRSSVNQEDILDRLEGWAEKAKPLKLKKSQMKAFEATVPVYRSAAKKGDKAFGKASRLYR